MTNLPAGLPSSVKVGHLDYAIMSWGKRAAHESDRMGECGHQTLEIRIDFDHHPRQSANTLLHEITHAIWWAYGLQAADDQERTVTVLANGWSQVWRDNPSIFAWIVSMLTDERPPA